MLIAAGLFLAAGKIFGFLAVSAVLLVWLGIFKIRSEGDMKGYVITVIGAVILLSNHLSIVIALILISLGYFLIRSKQAHSGGPFKQHQTIAESIHWDKEPWVLTPMSRWSILGEVRMDLSLALQEEEETTVMLQGIVGDVEIIVPEDYGVLLEANVLLGRIGVGQDKDAGLLNKRMWKSPNYEQSSHKLKLIVSYAVGNVEVKML